MISVEQFDYEQSLEQHIEFLQEKADFLQSMLDSFWTGDVPDDATLDHVVLAKAGRLRIAEKAKLCKLLS